MDRKRIEPESGDSGKSAEVQQAGGLWSPPFRADLPPGKSLHISGSPPELYKMRGLDASFKRIFKL